MDHVTELLSGQQVAQKGRAKSCAPLSFIVGMQHEMEIAEDANTKLLKGLAHSLQLMGKDQSLIE